MKPDTLPSWARWLAEDADGALWAYEHEPNRGDHGWYENEVGRCQLIEKKSANKHWRTSLRKV